MIDIENRVWNLFKETGDIRCFNLLGKIERSKRNGNSKNRRNYRRGNEL